MDLNAPPKMTLHPLSSKGGAFVLKFGLIFRKATMTHSVMVAFLFLRMRNLISGIVGALALLNPADKIKPALYPYGNSTGFVRLYCSAGASIVSIRLDTKEAYIPPTRFAPIS